MRGSQLIAGVVVTAVLGMAGAVQARAAGYFNLPGTIAQWAGHGYGAGYHAAADSRTDQVRRLACATRGPVTICSVCVVRLCRLRRWRSNGGFADDDGGRCADDRCAERSGKGSDAGHRPRRSVFDERDSEGRIDAASL